VLSESAHGHGFIIAGERLYILRTESSLVNPGIPLVLGTPMNCCGACSLQARTYYPSMYCSCAACTAIVYHRTKHLHPWLRMHNSWVGNLQLRFHGKQLRYWWAPPPSTLRVFFRSQRPISLNHIWALFITDSRS